MSQIENLEKMMKLKLNEERSMKEELENGRSSLDNERVEKGILVMEVNKLRGELESKENQHQEERQLSAEVIATVNEKLNKKSNECETLTNELGSHELKIRNL